jgi:hypothetical protein
MPEPLTLCPKPVYVAESARLTIRLPAQADSARIVH